MLTRWQGFPAAGAVTLVTAGLIIADVADAGLRHWWLAHALTTDTVAGLLVVLITVLVVDQLVTKRQLQDRARATGAQAAIMLGQAARSSQAVSAALAGTGDRSAAGEEVRTYMIMLLVGAPVLIEARASRQFLEDAQRLGGEMVLSLSARASVPGPGAGERLESAVARLRAAAAPLARELNPDERSAVGLDESP